MADSVLLVDLNRSQPPLLTQMVRIYVEKTNDTQLLERALPLLIKEHEWWTTNRTVEISKDDRTYSLTLYNVSNTQPRPESYYEDYTTASNVCYPVRLFFIPSSCVRSHRQSACLASRASWVSRGVCARDWHPMTLAAVKGNH